MNGRFTEINVLKYASIDRGLLVIGSQLQFNINKMIWITHNNTNSTNFSNFLSKEIIKNPEKQLTCR